ncbi:hypothetical protein [Nitrosospira multiformis]|uniref:DUF3987 domain-containing protein n=1 Tax=Nitrosospira multiformis TaxID=1231 RepID=A0A1I7IWB3_9PROT|nr:hypothetical protein [Nitrosospira multiformis]SFU77216.1 hypothetical protein SAMN05216417_1298 [Nitrosospira multiformis]
MEAQTVPPMNPSGFDNLQAAQPQQQAGQYQSTNGTPKAAPAGLQPEPAAPQAPHLERDYEHFPEYPEYAEGNQRTPWPPGFLGKIAQYLYCHSPSPVPDYAIAAAVAFFAGICGRGWIYSHTGLNHDIIVLGESGTGKNIIHQGIANVGKQLSGTPIDTFIVNAKMASASALLKNVAANPCFLQLIGEVGKMYRAYSKSKHGDTLDTLFAAKLDLWERSGPDGASVGILYSNSANNILPNNIMGIAHSTIGESTPGVFYGALTTDMMNDGLLSRLWIIEYEGADPEFNEHRLHEMPREWINYLSNLVRAASGRLHQQPVDHSVEAAALIRAFVQDCKDEKLNAGKDPAQRQLWVRAYEKVIRLAALLAVADNYLFPVVEVAHVEWATSMLQRANLTVQRRACDGDITEDADHAREQMILQRCRRWLTTPRKDPKEEKLRASYVISRRFLQQEVCSKDLFKKHRLGATTVFNHTMKSLVENGYLVKLGELTTWNDFNVRADCWKIVDLSQH